MASLRLSFALITTFDQFVCKNLVLSCINQTGSDETAEDNSTQDQAIEKYVCILSILLLICLVSCCWDLQK